MRLALPITLLLLAALACAAPEEDLECGIGTHEDDGECVRNPSGGDADTDSDTDSDTDTDTDTDLGPSLFGVDPPYGTDGSSVRLTGTGLADVLSVRFGSSEATITSATAGVVELTVNGSAAGTLDIDVTTPDGSATLPDAFEMFEDATGRTGAFGNLVWVHMLGGYWDVAEDVSSASLYLVEPADFRYADLFGAGLDTCVSDPDQLSIGGIDVGARSATLAGALDDVVLTFGSPSFLAEDLTSRQWTADTAYDLTFDANFGAVDIPGFVRTPTALEVISPNLDTTELPRLARSDLDFRWVAEDGDGVFIRLELFNSGGTALTETVTCSARDDGAFTVPVSVWTSWAADRTLYVSLLRHVDSTATLPYNNADVEFPGVYWAYGAGLTE